MNYAELQVTTNFSFLRGGSHPEELVEYAEQLGYAAIAITDRNTLAGIVRAHAAARGKNIRIIPACRLDLQDGPSLLAYPTSKDAYGRLSELLSTGNLRTEKGKCDLYKTDVYKYAAGIIFIVVPPPELNKSFDFDSSFKSALQEYKQVLGINLYLAVNRTFLASDHKRIFRLARLSTELNIPLVATNDVHYHNQHRRELQDVLTCVREKCTIHNAGFKLHQNAERYLKPIKEMHRLFAQYPIAIKYSLEIAKACQFSLDSLEYIYPKEITSEGRTPQEELTYLAWEGAKEKFGEDVPQPVIDAIQYELDFFDGNVDTTDYDYDANGNLIKDLNKAITSITYNYMNKPTQVISGGGSINYIYDGAGNLLQKKTTVAGIDTTYRYWGPFEYRDTKLMQFTHQEGRSRWMPDSTKFKHDFFIKDHLGNVRSIVTADISYGNQQYWAGFELAAALTEQALFTQVGEIRDTKPSGTPGDLMSGQLDGSDPSKRIGTALLFKAHPGDQVDLRTWGYYEEADSADMNIYAPSEDMFTALTNTFSSGLVGGGEGGAPTVTPGVISGILTNTNYNIYESMKNAVTDNAYPRLYLNCLVFDDALNLLPDQSSVTQLRGGSNTWNPLDRNTTWQVEAENYVLVYVSMESTKKIYIDNTNIVVINGRQLQEQHYYPYGRLIEQQTPSVPSLTSNYLYQTKKLEKTANLELYDFHARQYDAQIGRFCAVDPMQEFASGYVGMGNDPANLVDPTGMQTSTSPTASGPPMDPAYDPNTWNRSGPTKGAPVAYARSSRGWTPVDILFDGETTDVEFFPDLQGKSVLVLGGKGGKATGTIDRIVGGRLMFKDYSYNNFIPFSSPQYDPMWSANATDLWRGGITESVFVGNYSLRFHMSSHMYQTTSNLERTLKTVAKYLRAADEFLYVGGRQNGYEYTSKNIYRGNEAHRNPKAKKLYGIIDVDMIVNAMNTFGAGSGQFGKLSNTLGAWEGFAGAADATHTAIDEYGMPHHGEKTHDTTVLQDQAYRVISRDSSGKIQRLVDYFE